MWGILVSLLFVITKSFLLDDCTTNGCNMTWINDGYCDRNCKIESCDYDGEDCISDQTCQSINDDNEFCTSLYDIFDFVANSIIVNDKINEQEICISWTILNSYSPLPSDCSSVISIYDIDNDQLLSFNEFILLFDYGISETKKNQIDCGCCSYCNTTFVMMEQTMDTTANVMESTMDTTSNSESIISSTINTYSEKPTPLESNEGVTHQYSMVMKFMFVLVIFMGF